MMVTVTLLDAMVLAVIVVPAALVVVLGGPSLLRRPLGEAAVERWTRVSMLITFLAATVGLILYHAGGQGQRVLSLGEWFAATRWDFSFDFLVDGLSLGFAVLSAGICGIVARFSSRYLHREPGHPRYFILFAIFLSGIMLIVLAGSIEVLFVGWELVGLSSALLVGFFHNRPAPVVNGLRVFAIYRISDAAMLLAAALLHHWAGSGALSLLFSGHGTAVPLLSTAQSTAIAILLLSAVAGKSALLPFSGWLPRAMEGPTPSSAVYYGALSIHAGCFLLLRASPLLELAPVAGYLAVAAGAATAIHATLVERVQTDMKSSLAYASLTQVGIIVVEIGLGFDTLAFVHIVGHACFRLFQFLTAPNVLHDLHGLESAVGHRLGGEPRERSAGPLSTLAYLVTLERGFVDEMVDRAVVRPFGSVAAWLDRLDRSLCGRTSPDAGAPEHTEDPHPHD